MSMKKNQAVNGEKTTRTAIREAMKAGGRMDIYEVWELTEAALVPSRVIARKNLETALDELKRDGEIDHDGAQRDDRKYWLKEA